MSNPPPKSDAGEGRPSTRLAHALMLVVNEHAVEFGLSEGGVLGALTLALGWATGSAARRSEHGFDGLTEFVVQYLRRVASDAFKYQASTVH